MTRMHTDHLLTCEDVYRSPAISSRVFHWEHLPQSTRDHIQSLINGAIDNEIAENLAPGSDIIEAEVVVQVTIHTQIAEY